MRYASIRNLDISNGNGIGVALFVQGCNFHCLNCFNPETWDFNGGKEWTPEVEDKFIELANRPYIKRISLLGGECLANKNLNGVLNLVNKISLLKRKTIWLYSGYTWEEVFSNDDDDSKKRAEIISLCDVFVDGRYIDSQRDITLAYRGSKNQRIIDVQQSLQRGEIVLWTT